MNVRERKPRQKKIRYFSKRCLKYIHKKIPVLESLFNNVAGVYSCKLIKKRLQQMCLSVNIAKFLRMSLFIEYV